MAKLAICSAKTLQGVSVSWLILVVPVPYLQIPLQII